MRKALFALMGMAVLVCAAQAQDKKEFPKPGKEHSTLKQQFEGDWDAVSRHEAMEGKEGKGDKSAESKGTESVKSDFDGYWIIFDYKGDMDGKAFHGHGVMGYDPMKKKYLLTWIDNMAPFAMWAEGYADASGKAYSFKSEGFCPDLGKVATVRTVFEFQDPNHRSLTFYMPGKDGPEKKMGEIRYTRKS